MDLGQIQLALRLLAHQQQIHQIVVRDIHQPGKGVYLFIGHIQLPRVKITREDQIVFQQSATRTPTQACTVLGIGLMGARHNDFFQ